MGNCGTDKHQSGFFGDLSPWRHSIVFALLFLKTVKDNFLYAILWPFKCPTFNKWWIIHSLFTFTISTVSCPSLPWWELIWKINLLVWFKIHIRNQEMSKKIFVQFSFHLSTLSLTPAFCILLKLPSDLIAVVATAINNRQPVCGENTMCSAHTQTRVHKHTPCCAVVK